MESRECEDIIYTGAIYSQKREKERERRKEMCIVSKYHIKKILFENIHFFEKGEDENKNHKKLLPSFCEINN